MDTEKLKKIYDDFLKTKGKAPGRTVLMRLSGLHEGAVKTFLMQLKPITADTTKNIGTSISDFRAKNNHKVIIQKILSSLPEDMIFNKKEIKIMAGCSANSIHILLNDDSFNDYRGRKGAEYYYSHPDTIIQLKKEGTLL